MSHVLLMMISPHIHFMKFILLASGVTDPHAGYSSSLCTSKAFNVIET